MSNVQCPPLQSLTSLAWRHATRSRQTASPPPAVRRGAPSTLCSVSPPRSLASRSLPSLLCGGSRLTARRLSTPHDGLLSNAACSLYQALQGCWGMSWEGCQLGPSCPAPLGARLLTHQPKPFPSFPTSPPAFATPPSLRESLHALHSEDYGLRPLRQNTADSDAPFVLKPANPSQGFRGQEHTSMPSQPRVGPHHAPPRPVHPPHHVLLGGGGFFRRQNPATGSVAVIISRRGMRGREEVRGDGSREGEHHPPSPHSARSPAQPQPEPPFPPPPKTSRATHGIVSSPC
ncbi:hypothetical protein E2C01_101761 [Portunus trituberculatus]|uniref:Uncharacterized protein n=1 Tax=Portunus trituberculatus TaxID=210409 RepID=A0A5B7KMP9_PORTR|nr:hypothetical protein [Portunus trituberculatus]